MPPLDPQEELQKILTGLLYKKGYCLCIPEPKLVQRYLSKLHPVWIQTFLLTKNDEGFSVLPMFVLIFIKNKHLKHEETEHLKQLLDLLIKTLTISAVSEILLEQDKNNTHFFYYLFYQFMQLNLNDFIASDEKHSRVLGLAESIKLLLEKADSETITHLVLNTGGKGFWPIRKIMYMMAYNSLHRLQLDALVYLAETLIHKTTPQGIEEQVFRIQYKGMSFISCCLFSWMQIAGQSLEANKKKLTSFSAVITLLLDKTTTESLSNRLLAPQGHGLSLIVDYIYFFKLSTTLNENERNYLDGFFNQWLKKLFSVVHMEQIEPILQDLLLRLENFKDNLFDKKRVMGQFFDYLVHFSVLQSDERRYSILLNKYLYEPFSSSNKEIGMYQKIKARFGLFKQRIDLQDTQTRGIASSAAFREKDSLMGEAHSDRADYGSIMHSFK